MQTSFGSAEAAAPARAATPAAWTATEGTANVTASLSFDDVWAHGFASYAGVTLTIQQSPGGTVLATRTKTADGVGNADFIRGQDHDIDLVAGMQVSVTDGSSTKQLTLVTVAISSMNVVTNQLAGIAPTGAALQVGVGENTNWAYLDTLADGSGHWLVDFSPFDVTTTMWAWAHVADADGDATSYDKAPADIDASVTYDAVTANHFAPNSTVTVTIRAPDGSVLASQSRQTDASGGTTFSRNQDYYVDLVPGMQVTVTDGVSTKELTLAPVSVMSVDPATDDVAGTAPPGAQARVNVSTGQLGTGMQVTAGGDGRWFADFTGTFDVTYSSHAGIWLADADNDTTSAGRNPARVDASLTGDSIWASGFAGNSSVTMTILQSPGGTQLASQTRPTDGAGNASFNRYQGYDVDLVPGMQVVVTDGPITKGLTLVAVAITRVNPATELVTGTAPADAEVQVSLDNVFGLSPKVVHADVNGHWSADYAGTYDITFATRATASVPDADGDTTNAQRGTAMINASLTDDAISANTFVNNGTVTFTILDAPGGTVLAQQTKPTDSAGNAQYNRQDHNVDLVPGMHVTVSDGTVTKGLTLATLAITSVNASADVVTGTAPADTQVQVNVNGPGGGNSKTVTASASGTWSADFTGVYDITFATNVDAWVDDVDGDMTHASRAPAMVFANLHGGLNVKNFVHNGTVDYTILQSPGGTILKQGSKPTDEAGTAQIQRFQDFDIDLVPGMQVTVTDGVATKDVTLAAIAISSVDPATDVVAGTAPPGAQVNVNVNANDGSGSANAQATATGDGHWSADFTGSFDVTFTTNAHASVLDEDGDGTNVHRGVPTIEASLNWDSINGNAFAGGAEITCTIRQSPGGAQLATGHRTSDPNGNVNFNRGNDYTVDLVPGMQITLTDGTTTKQLTLVALATTLVDPATDVVSGTAPPGVQVKVNIGDESGGTTQTTTADGTGHWSVDFSPFDVTYTMWAAASVADSDGDSTVAGHGVATIDVALSWNNIQANGFAADTEVSFTIRQSPGGAQLADGHRTSDQDGNVQFFADWGDFAVDLMPGMEVTVSDGTVTKQLTLVAIAIDLVDPATDVVAGTAPAGAHVQVGVGQDMTGSSQETTADGSGHWSVDFTGNFDITYASGANARVTDDDGDTTQANGGAPTINVSVSYDGIAANNFAAHAEVSYTIRESPGGAELMSGHKTSNSSGYVEFNRWDDYDVDLVPGMEITVTDGTLTKHLTLAPVAIDSVNPETDSVTGTAPAGAHVWVDVGDDNSGMSGETTAGGAGDWSVDFTPFDITYSMSGHACVADGDGDMTNADKNAPSISGDVTWDGIWGNGFVGNADVTFTIRQAPGGAILDSGVKTSDANGDVELGRFQDYDVDLAPGMQITMGDGTLTKQLTLAALVIDSVNPSADVVAGGAPAGALVHVELEDGDRWASEETTAGGNGKWSISFSGTFDITYTTGALATVRDADADTTFADKQAPTIGGDLTMDTIWANGFLSNASVTFTIRQSPSGDVLASGAKTSDAAGWVDFSRGTEFNVNLAAGMQVTITDGTTTKQLTLAALAITSVNPATNVVAGTAPAGALVQVGVGDDNDGTGQETTAGGDGTWSIDFSPFDITSAMRAGASVADNDGDTTSASWVADLRFSVANYTVSEGAGTVEITVQRIGSAPAEVGVSYTTSNGTATAGSDYTATSGTLTFPEGTSRTFIVAITDDTAHESDETVNLTLSDARGGGVLTSPFTATITIQDNDAADTTPPVTTIDSGPSGPTNDTTPTFTFSANEPATFECHVDTAAFAACTSPHTTAALTDGPHTFYVRATDTAHNLGAAVSRGFTVDTLLPVTTIDSGPTGATNDSTPTFTFSANETATFQCHVDTAAFATCTSPYTTAALADGPHTFYARATDTAGNQGSAASRTFTVDTVLPVTTIDSGPTGPTNDSTPTFTFSANELATFECHVDTGAFAACTSPHTTATLADGPHTFYVRATDTVGNLGAAVSRTFTVDTAAPLTTIDSGPAGPTNDSTPTFIFSANETATFQCHVDTAAFAACTSPYTTIALADSAHTFYARATDTAGNQGSAVSRTFTVDTAAPVTTIDSGPTSATNDATPTFTFSANETATFECHVDTAAFAACTSPYTTTALADGPHTFYARATDAAGNLGSAVSRTFTVDTAAPLTTIDSGPTGGTNDTTPTFTFSASEAATFQCRVDTASFATCTSPYTTGALADGPHTFQVRATDTAGNQGPAVSRSITVDTVLPVTTIDSGPSGPTNDSTPTFTFSANETATFECRVDDGTFAACNSAHTTVALADGPHTFQVRATDTAGNLGAAASRTFTVETGAPVTTIDSGPSGPTNDTTPTFTFSASEPATFECHVDAGNFAACTSPYTTATLTDGAHTFQVRATDTASNVGAAASRTFTVDTVMPATTIDSGPSGLTNDSTPTFAFSGNEAATFECRVDAGNFAACTSPYTTATLTDGAHTFQARATDTAGNLGAAASRTFTVHTGVPVVTVNSGPSGLTNDTTPTFAFAADEQATFECSVDGGAFAPCTAPFTAAPLPDGVHSFLVRATDMAGNVCTPVSRTFTVHTGLPVTTIDAGPSGPTSDTTPTFAFAADETATFECRVDAATFASCVSPFTTSALADGSHTFDVRATDLAGNLGSAVSRTFAVDTAAPETTIDSGPTGDTTDSTPTFTFSAAEPGATFECRVDGAAFAACSSPFTTTTLGTGAHTFDVRAVDGLGNADSTPASRAFTVTKPSVPPAKATLTIVTRSVTVTPTRVAAVKLRCGSGARCQGVLTLTASVDRRLLSSRAGRIQLKLGSAGFSIAAGRTATVKVKISTAGYKLLVRVKRLSAQARATLKQPSGGTTTAAHAITLKAPAKR